MPNPIHIFRQEQIDRERREALDKRYMMMFMEYPDVREDMMKDLGLKNDIDPHDPAANALRNYGIYLAGRAGFEIVLRKKEEE